jgi:hypothetical protein
MKILFVGSLKYDYLQDLTYNGLVKTLGQSSVIEAKTILRYHIPIKKYPKDIGYNGINLSFFTTVDYKSFDLVVVAACKPDCFEMYESILPKLSNSVKTIFLDGGDHPEVGGDFGRLKNPELFQKVTEKRPFDFVFKREFLKNSDYSSNTHPFPFSVQTNCYPSIVREPYKYDVAFWAVESDPIRTKVLDFLNNRFDCAENGTVKNQSFHGYKRKGMNYFKELKRTRISLNFRGTGWDTLRFWELLGNNCFFISQRLQIEIPNDFVEGKEIVFCNDDLSDLDDLCRYYLKEEAKRQQITKNAYAKVLKSHTVECRAKYLLNTCGY